MDIPYVPTTIVVGLLEDATCPSAAVTTTGRVYVYALCPTPDSAPSVAEAEARPLEETEGTASRDHVSLFGLTIPTHQTGSGTLASGIPAPTRVRVVGAGGVLGGGLIPVAPTFPISPAGFLSFERGGPRAQFFWSIDSAPLFIWSLPSSQIGWHLVNVSTGLTVGSPQLRAGLFITAGVLNAGAGLRFRWTPWQSGTRVSGFEARLTAFYPYGGHGGIYWVQSFARRSREQRKDAPPPRDRKAGLFVCQRLNLGVGGTVVASSTERSWAHLGQEVGLDLNGSPAITAGCETGGTAGGLQISVNTAPFAYYRLPLDGTDTPGRHMASATFGAFVGSSAIRFGPTATAGIWIAGAGLRAVLAPIPTQGGFRHGLEFRADLLVPYTPAFSGAVFYHLAWDPRRE